MSSSHSCASSNQAERVEPNPTEREERVFPNRKDDREGSVPKFPKIWNIEDSFQFAPPKPDGDPWMLLLEPLLKKDKTRCDSWRDEVQNLLIFAGLFSAVVTAFIVESYKNLQQDPNEIMITLLSHIATRLDTPLNSNSTLPLPTISLFSPSTSSIRVNAFWFISLVLSLTTVLVGTISLQWLREHQTYSDLSPREIYAIYHMRFESLAKWHVDKIFTTMPLLLQCALVLFLVGIIDFLQTFGHWAVVVPVAVVMGLTLIFLVATAVLPSLQMLSLYFNFSDERNRPGSGGSRPKAPSPCPYKSPQSHAIRTVLGPVFTLFDNLHPRVRRFIHRARRLSIHLSLFSKSEGTDSAVPEKLESETFTRYLLYASYKSRWVDFDVSWLAIRDGYMRRAFGRAVWFESIGTRDDEIEPLLDVVRGLSGQGYQRTSYGAAYHCFAEVSEMTLRPLKRRDYMYSGDGNIKNRFLQSAYLHDMLEASCAGLVDVFELDEVLLRGIPGDGINQPRTLETLHAILHQQNLFGYLGNHYFSDGSLLSNHRKELSLRLSAYFYLSNHALRNEVEASGGPGAGGALVKFPSCLTFSPYEALLEPSVERKEFNLIAWQVAHVMLSILQRIDAGPSRPSHPGIAPPPSSLLLNPFAQKAGLPAFIQGAGYFTCLAIGYATNHHNEDEDPSGLFQHAITEKYHEIFTFIEDKLTREILSWPTAQGHGPGLLFYVVALYAHMSLAYGRWDERFSAMRNVICMYKRRTVDMGVVDRGVEGRLAEDNLSWRLWDKKPFSGVWWEEFEASGLHLGGHSHGGEGGSVRSGIGGREGIVVFYPFDTPQHPL